MIEHDGYEYAGLERVRWWEEVQAAWKAVWCKNVSEFHQWLEQKGWELKPNLKVYRRSSGS